MARINADIGNYNPTYQRIGEDDNQSHRLKNLVEIIATIDHPTKNSTTMGTTTIETTAMTDHAKDPKIVTKIQIIEIDQTVQVIIGTDQIPATKKEGIVHLIITSTENKETGLES